MRIADALGFTVPPPVVFDRSAKYLLLFGYKLLSGKWFGGAPVKISDAENEPRLAGSGELLRDPYEAGIRLLQKAALGNSGRLSPELREAAVFSAEIPGLLGEYVRRVRHCAWEITDADIEALRGADYEEDQIFEATVCAALGAGLARLKQGLAVLHQAVRHAAAGSTTYV